MTDLLTPSTISLLVGLPPATQLELLTSTLEESGTNFSDSDIQLLTEAGIPIPAPLKLEAAKVEAKTESSKKLGTKQFTIASSPIFSIYFQGPAPASIGNLPAEPTPELLPSLAEAGCIKVRAIGHPSTTSSYRTNLTAQLRSILNHEPPIIGSQYKSLIHSMLVDHPQLVVAMGGLNSIKDRLFNPHRLTAAYSEWLAIQPLLPTSTTGAGDDVELPTVEDINSLFDSLP